MSLNLSRPLTLVFIACLMVNFLKADDQLEELKQKTDRWIELRTRLAEEKSTWQSDREILRTSIETLEANVNAVDESLEFYKNAIRDLESELDLAKQKEASALVTTEQMTRTIEIYEERIRSLFTRLPQPLMDQLSTLISKIPSDSSANAPPLANRLQNVVAIMTMIDEFNQNLTHSRAVKAFEGEQSIEVRALYWGLSFGLATNTDGQRAWLLRPDENGWQWIDQSANATAVNEVFLVYDKKVDPKIVTIPFQANIK